ncbi:N(2)-fixation sustaining protein CowN [Agaribacterium sp. ZY112]|uniref:N(2)-fixation sustaining protein CowN n=1 Tax=Agaribacterium sp. ZY112 TaxID=3233574 RepID=UPI003524F9AB
MTAQAKPDRYVSFCNIHCDQDADELVTLLNTELSNGSGRALWQDYFAGKKQQQMKLEQDNLLFIGTQVNVLFEYFTEVGNDKAIELLEKIEEQCL